MGGGAGVPWLGRDGLAHRQVASLYESGQTSLQCSTVKHDVSLAGPAAQADVRAETIYQPLPAPTGMGASQRYDVAEQELDDPRLLGLH
jgi:hypothetical protein